jgi:hypothetical protein
MYMHATAAAVITNTAAATTNQLHTLGHLVCSDSKIKICPSKSFRLSFVSSFY